MNIHSIIRLRSIARLGLAVGLALLGLMGSITVLAVLRLELPGEPTPVMAQEPATTIGLTGQEDLASNWSEYSSNPVFDPPSGDRAYYQTVIYDTDQFDHHGEAAYYKMWYSAGSNRLGLATSDDGLTWTEAYTQLSGLAKPHHAQVVYDSAGFGGSDVFYKMWYWNTDDIYNVNALHYAESANGVTWSNVLSITQDGGKPIVTGVGSDWNYGTYGPITVLYNASGSATLDDATLWNNRYVMYYDGTTGAFEQVGLGYSADGKHWKRYGDDPVLPSGSDWQGTWGLGTPWDSSYATFGTVLRTPDGKYHFWYSGGANSTDHGIGYATSSDGVSWSRSVANPVFHKSDGPAWRSSRTYTPRVLYSPTCFEGHGSPAQYKMWFTGKQSSPSNYTIGYAALDSVLLADSSGSGQSGPVSSTLNQAFVVELHDSCHNPVSGVTVTFTLSNTPAGAGGQSLSLISGPTNSDGKISTTLTLGNEVGQYTVIASATGVISLPTTFTATATIGTISPEGAIFLPIIIKSTTVVTGEAIFLPLVMKNGG